ncbi:site-specific DNA-methyltransferase [Nocardia fluminea]|uniref:site-specific DNA-methyltransferase n=1 Tax=Nocardia fluminea TaxID=134984 RepID=UPI003661B839
MELEDLQLLSKDELIEVIGHLQGEAEPGVKLTFPGKATARRITRRVRPRVQRTIAKYGAGTQADRAKNLLIEGDNLQALATLYRERGNVDLVLTDPPYNTGGDWRYNDKWDEDPNDPGIGDLVRDDDRARHTKWMKFMYPRLLLMKHMLKPSGVLAICIDFRELFHLGQMLDEIFGERNRIGIINWQRTYSKQNDAGHLATVTEYVLVYAKDADRAKTSLLQKLREGDASDNPDKDPEPWTDAPATASNAKAHKSMVYAIQNPFTGELIYPPRGSAWRNDQQTILSELRKWNVDFTIRDIGDLAERATRIGIAADKVPNVGAIVFDEKLSDARRNATEVLDSGVWPAFYFLRQGYGKPRAKKYLKDMRAGEVATTFWASDDFEVASDVSWPHPVSGHSEQGVKELTAVIGEGHEFKTVKPLRLFSKIIELWCPSEGLVLDPFAGSGTTGHAVMALNYERSVDRRFILIEQGSPERKDSFARTLTAPRLQRVVSGNWDNGRGIPLGSGFDFRTLTKQVDAKALLAMERDEMVDTVIASYFDSSRRRGSNLIPINDRSCSYLVAHNADYEGFYLVWGGAGENTDLTEEVYESCVLEGEKAKLKPVYHIYSRFNLFATPGVHWYQIPDRILADFGLDIRTESYIDEDE